MRLRLWIATAAAAACVTTGLIAQETKPAAPSAADQAAMEAWAKAATPGDAHKKLAPMVGSFTATVRSWMVPGAPPMESTGTSENKWILDGRWVEQQFHGSFMGMPFDGVGMTGYNNIRKEYTGTWVDNMSTSMMTSRGTADANGKSWKFAVNSDNAMTGKSEMIDETIVVTDEDHHNFEMWGPGPDGKKFKMMEISYTRKK